MTVGTIAPPRKMPWDAAYTWDDLVALPDDGLIYEIIDGELWETAPPVPIHQRLSVRLSTAFYQAGELTGLGRVYASPIGVELAERDIVQPDLVFVIIDRVGIEKDSKIVGSPDIVVEILSPSTRSKDLNEKAALYARAGVREYWQVDPRWRMVTVLELRDGAYLPLPIEDGIARSRVLPDLEIDVKALFDGLD